MLNKTLLSDIIYFILPYNNDATQAMTNKNGLNFKLVEYCELKTYTVYICAESERERERERAGGRENKKKLKRQEIARSTKLIIYILCDVNYCLVDSACIIRQWQLLYSASHAHKYSTLHNNIYDL